jgi:ParB family transcriptional regulator, chromosome partitioning protein
LQVSYAAKIDAHIKQTVTAKPKLVQISTAYGKPAEDSPVIPRNKYVEIRQDTPKSKHERDWPEYKTCKFTTDAIVTEGTEKGETKSVRQSRMPGPSPEAAATAQLPRRRIQGRTRKAPPQGGHREGHRSARAQSDWRCGSRPADEARPALYRRTANSDAGRTAPRRSHPAAWHRQAQGRRASAKLLAAFLPKAEENKLGRILVETVILLSMQNQTDTAKILRDAAHLYKVDVDAISATVKQEFAAKEKAKITKKAAPKSASKPAKKAAA